MASNPHVPDNGLYPRGFSMETDWRWPLVKASDLVVLNYGKALREGDRRDGNVPVYGTNGRCGWNDQGLREGPGLILGRKGQGPLGVEWCDTKFWVIDTAYFATPVVDDLDLRYLYYLVKYIGLNHLKDGTSNPGLSRDTFGHLLLPHPPLNVQRQIARVLTDFDNKIELNRRMNQTLESMARAIFKSWFVDFDPVRAKAGGRQTGLAPELSELFPTAFEDSEVGRIPVGWSARTVGDLAEVVGGGTPSTKEAAFWEQGEFHWTTPRDLSSLVVPVLLEAERKITAAGLRTISSGLLPIGTVLLSSRAPIGYLAVAELPTAINQGFIAMKSRNGVSNLFLLYWAEANHETILSRANGSTFLEISKANFRPILVAVPNEGVMAQFDSMVRPMHERVVANERQSRTLAEIRDLLLPKLVSGQIRVNDPERFLEERGL